MQLKSVNFEAEKTILELQCRLSQKARNKSESRDY